MLPNVVLESPQHLLLPTAALRTMLWFNCSLNKRYSRCDRYFVPERLHWRNILVQPLALHIKRLETLTNCCPLCCIAFELVDVSLLLYDFRLADFLLYVKLVYMFTCNARRPRVLIVRIFELKKRTQVVGWGTWRWL